MKGEASSADYGFLSAKESVETYKEPEASLITTEKPLAEKIEPLDDIQLGHLRPKSTTEQRRYSAPWDPIQ